MTRDEIIRMARQVWPTPTVLPMDELARFAELIVASERTKMPPPPIIIQNADIATVVGAAIRTEREACAKVCDERALRNEAYAQDAIANGENGEVSSLRAAAWQMKVCATEIRHRCDELPNNDMKTE